MTKHYKTLQNKIKFEKYIKLIFVYHIAFAGMVKGSGDYANGKIYGLYQRDNNRLVYVGSTTTSLNQRLYRHKIDADIDKERPIYKYFNEEGGISNFYIELIEKFPCNSKQELTQREGQIQRETNILKDGFNRRIAGRTKAEYLKDNKEQVEQRHKNYYARKGDVIRAQKRQYHADNKHQISEKNKASRQQNKESISARRKKYRDTNKEKIKEQKRLSWARTKDNYSERTECECGGEYTVRYKNAHEQTVRHLTYINGLAEDIPAAETNWTRCECGGKYTGHNKIGHEKTLKHQVYIERKDQNTDDNIISAFK